VVAGGIHTVNHWIDLPLGGHNSDVWLIGLSTLLAVVALLLRLRDPRPASRQSPRRSRI
jgi:hypothetical protein